MSSKSTIRSAAIVLGLLALAVYVGYIAWIGIKL